MMFAFCPDASLLGVAIALHGTSANMCRGSSAHGCVVGEMMQVIEMVGKKKPRFLSVCWVCQEWQS
jgi:hypothetical protein